MPADLTTISLPGYSLDSLSTTSYDYLNYTTINESTTLTDCMLPDSCKSTKLFTAENVYIPAIPEQHVKVFSHITQSYINPSLGIVGFVGNILGVGVLWRQARQHKLSIFWYLCALTIADVVFLLTAIVYAIPRVVDEYDKELSKYLTAHFRTRLAFVDNTLVHTARYIVLVMSCDRLISVVRPLHAKNSCFSKYPLRIVIGCFIFNAIIASPLLIFSTVNTIEKDNITEYVFTFRHLDTFVVHWWLAEAIIHNFIPIFLLVPINIAIPVKFYKATKRMRHVTICKRRKHSAEGTHQQGKVTVTVMAITIMYIFLSIPLMVMKSFQYINPDFNVQGKHRLYFWFMADMSKCMAYINAATDFIVYFLVSNNYRVVFKAMYCGVCTKNKRKEEQCHTDLSAVESKGTLYTIAQ